MLTFVWHIPTGMKNLILFFCLILSAPIMAHSLQPQDSVGIKEVNGQYFIMHKVEKGEGLYAIARKYNANVDDIKKANPEGVNGLQIGQIILVPIPKPVVKTETPKEETVLHVVKSGETLYSISKQYNVSVDQIKQKNKLSSNSLNVGQELVIKGEKPAEHTENYGGEEKPTPQPKENKPEKAVEPKGKYEYNAVTGEVKEQGYAVVAINESMNQERSFCLHPTAEVGTIIMVTNLATNKSVFVRVVGKPENLDSQVVIKLSQTAGKRLGIADNDRANVRLNYTK